MGGLFGILGMIIAVPSFAVIAKIIDDKTKERAAQKASKRAERRSGVAESETAPDTDGTQTSEAESEGNEQ